MAIEPNSCGEPIRTEMDFRIEAGDWPAVDELEAIIDATILAVLNNSAFYTACSVMQGSEVSLLLTDDKHITAINSEFRGQKKPTNVLSFPQQDADCDVYGPYLGDIVLAYETVFREADLENKDFNHHFQHLLVHGFLHLVGFDHETDNEAKVMENLEIDILRDLNIEDPYKDTIKR